MPGLPSWTTSSFRDIKPDHYHGRCSCGDVQVTVRQPKADASDVGDVLKNFFPVKNAETGDWQLVSPSCCCRDCTKSQGTLLASGMFIPAKPGMETLEWQDPKHRIVEYQSSENHTRTHCGNCGSQLAFIDPLIEKCNLPLGLFMRDDDDGKANAALASRLAVMPYSFVEHQKGVCIGDVDGGLTGVLRGNGVFAWDYTDGFQQPKAFSFSPTKKPDNPPERISLSCHCQSIKVALKYQAVQEGSHCACLSCVRASGGLLWSAMIYDVRDVEWISKSTHVRHGSRGFCDRCGAYVTWQSDSLPDMIEFSVGLLDDGKNFQTEPGKMRYVYLRDQKGLRLPCVDGEEKDGGLAAQASDEHPKYQGTRALGWREMGGLSSRLL